MHTNNMMTKRQNIPNDIQTVDISVSYGMGWNKWSTGRVYNTLSGYGFINGCRIGKVIGFGVV